MARKLRNNSSSIRRPLFEELEPRVLYSADLAPQAEVVQAEVTVVEPEPVESDTSSEEQLSAESTQDILVLDEHGEPFAESDAPTENHQDSKELIFISNDLTDHESLLSGLKSDNSIVVELDSQKDGWTQVLDALSQHENLNAVHFITHGDDAALKLGNQWINSNNLQENEDEFRVMQLSLSANADLLFYGCNLAESELGQNMLSTISEWTDADVAASTDLTGGAAHSADWDLEYEIGNIETAIAVTSEVATNWSGVLNTYTVTNTNASGAGSLLQAITDANANGGTDTIEFSIAGAGPHVISLTTALPNITGTTIIDGTTEPDYAGTPVIVLDGSATSSGHGLSILADNCIVRGLVIQNFTGNGININGASNCLIEDNYIGTDAAGSSAEGNSHGISLLNSANTNTVQNNVISGNSVAGVNINSNSDGNTFTGNIIGLNASGNAALGNGSRGINIATGTSSDNNIIGGTNVADRNIISGNSNTGIKIGVGTGNQILGNYIGTDITGTLDLGNGSDGIWLISTASGNTIGGSAAGSGNLISGNNGNGIFLDESDSNTIQGNQIGTNAAGTGSIANTFYGINLDNAASNTIGGNIANERNVISGNTSAGIALSGSSTTLNQITGNFIGVDATGNTALGNNNDGIIIHNGAHTNTIGGDRTAGEGNVISGNTGVNSDGIEIDNAGADNNKIYGNYIGTNHDGTAALGNARYGVVIYDEVQGTEVGGTGSGEGNIISGNGAVGVVIDGNGQATTNGNVIIANHIGTDVTGTVDLGNTTHGIEINNGATDTVIGGTTAAHRNLISGNQGQGIEVFGATTTGTQIQGNYIGTDSTGLVSLRNEGNGVRLSSNQSTVVGGAVSGAGNVISGNDNNLTSADGIYITGGSNHTIEGNIIGLGADGTTALGNYYSGIAVSNSSNNTIGGTTALARNVISANVIGITLTNNASSNTVIGNYVGTDSSGLVDKGNATDGIVIESGANNNTIGGNTSNHRNILSGNSHDGIWITGSGTDDNIVQGNWIGLDASGNALENSYHGIGVENDASNNLIGGTGGGEGNVIANNAWDGIAVSGGTGTGNALLQNAVFANGDAGIDINNDGFTSNDSGDGDVGPNSVQNFPVLASAASNGTNTVEILGSINTTANTDYRIEFFSSSNTGRQADQYIGSITITTDALGNANFNVSLSTAVTVGHYITAIATVDLGGGNYGDSSELAAEATVQTLTETTKLWITSDTDVSSSGVPGLDNWSNGQILQLANPNLSFDPAGAPANTSDGTFSSVLNLDNFAGDSDASIDALHYVSSDIRVGNPGGGADSFDLQTGDLIFSTGTTETLTGTNGPLAVTRDDAIVFRPTNAGDYSSGAFYFLLDGDQLSDIDNMHSITLIEQDVTIGDSVVSKGTFLMSEASSLMDIRHYTATGVGTGTNTQGTMTTLIDGSDIDFDSFVRGIDVAETDLTIGGTTIAAGSILVTQSSDDEVGDNAINVDQEDIFYLTITKTEWDQATTVADATLLLDGSDVALDTGDEDIWGFSFAGPSITPPANTAPAFGDNGNGLNSPTLAGSSFNLGYNSTLQPDGKILIAGVSTFATNDISLARYNADGSLDTSFGSGTGFTTLDLGGSESGLNLALQSDGKIIVVGHTDIGATNDLVVARFNSDGTIDTGFNGTGYSVVDVSGSDMAAAVVVQSDGKIVVSGSNAGSGNNFSVLRFNTDGSLDTGFDGDGIAEIDFGGSSFDMATSVALQTDGKIIVGGLSDNQFALARLTTSGSLDTSFHTDGLVITDFGSGNEAINGVAIQSDGKIVAGGSAHNGTDLDFALARYNTDGSLDTSFDSDGMQTANFVASVEQAYSVALTSDEKIVITGYTDVVGDEDIMVQRYNSDGSLDTSFNGGGTRIVVLPGTSEYPYSANITASDAVIVTGYQTPGSFLIQQLNEDGTPNTNTGMTTNLLDGNPTFTEDGTVVVLDSNVQIFDTELSAADNFDGASLTLERNGGANSDDIFSASGTLSALTEGGNLVVGGTTIGTLTTNSSGTLLLTFNSNATNALLNSAIQQIVYSNSSDNPPATVQINWTINDGNSGAQGSGGTLQSTGSTTINITASNDDPVITSDGGGATAAVNASENQTAVTTVTSSDVDLDTVTYSITGGGDSGLFSIDTNSGILTFTAAPDFETPTDNDTDGVYEVEVTADDGNGGTDSQAISVTVTDSIPVGHWTFDADATDSSASNNHGSFLDTAVVDNSAVTNKIGSGKLSLNQLDGNTDSSELSAHIADYSGLTEGTISAWFNTSAGGEQTILSASNSATGSDFLWLGINGSGHLVYEVRAGGFDQILIHGSTAVNDGQWHHVAITVDASGNKLYLDGVQQTTGGGDISYIIGSASTQSFFADAPSLDSMHIGTLEHSASAYSWGFNGLLDDVRIYDQAISAADIGDLQVASANSAPYFTSLPSAEADTIEALTGAISVTSGDFDNDGDVDLVSTTNTGQLRWHENDGSGNFSAGVVIATADDFSAVATYDLEGDGDMDIVAMNDDPTDLGDSVYVLTNNFIGSGSVTFNTSSFEGPGVGESDGGKDLAIGDIDGDGRADIAGLFYRSIGDSQLVMFEQNSTGVWTKTYSDAISNGHGIELVDLDGDTDLDIVTGDFQTREVHWYENDGNATAGFSKQLIHDEVTSQIFDVTVGDFDADGDSDIAFITWGATDVVVMLENDGAANPSFTRTQVDALTGLPYHINTADMNGDGTADLIITDEVSDSIYVYENDGSATFTRDEIDTESGGPVWVEAADVDGDGHNDLIFAARDDNFIGLHVNQNDGNYIRGSVNEDVTLGSLQVQVADDDIGLGELEITISVTNGDIILPTGGVTVTSGASGSSSVTFTGNVAAVNSTMNSMSYSATADFYGQGEVQIVVNDQGNTGGPQKTATKSLFIEVLPVADAPIFNGLDGTPAFTENGSAVVLDSNVTIYDAELSAADNFSGATLQLIRNGGPSVDDVFNNTGTLSALNDGGSLIVGGVTVGTVTNNAGGNLLLTFNSNATNARVNSVIQQIAYSNGNDTPPSSVQIDWTFHDGALQTTGNTTVSITPSNDAPVLTGTTLITNGTFDTDLSGWTTNSGNIDASGGEVRFGQVGGANGVLSQTVSTTIGETYYVTFNYGDRSATKTQSLEFKVTGASTVLHSDIVSGAADTTLQPYHYSFVADSTSTTLTFTDTSGDHSGVRGYLDNVYMGQAATPDAPLSYTENDAPTVINGQLNLVDIDDGNLESAVIQISGNYVNGEDTLAFVDQNGISGSWDSGTGILTLSGSATTGDYQTALRSITYDNSSDAPSTLTRTVSFTVNDGDANSNTRTQDITITAANDEQVIATNAGTTVVKGSSNNVVTTAMLETTDVDNTPVELVYTVDAIPSNGTLYNNGVALNNSDTFTQADINAGKITYDQDNSVTVSDSFAFTVDDGTGVTLSQFFNWTVTATNANPVVNQQPGGGTYNENGNPGTFVDITTTITDADGVDFDGGVLTTSITANGEADDRLHIVHEGIALGEVGISGSNVTYNFGAGAVIVGSFSGGSGHLDPLLITFNASADATAVSEVARQIAFMSVSEDPSGSQRTIETVITDGDGGTSNTDTRVMNVVPRNDEPSGSDNTITVTEDTNYTFVAGDFGFNDTDGDSLDRVWFTTLPAQGTLKYSGSPFSAGNWVDVSDISLGLLTYTPPDDVSGNGVTSFTFEVQDDGGTANFGVNRDQTANTISIDIAAQPDAPVITSDGGGTTAAINAAENQTAITTVTASDDDLDALSYSITGGSDQAQFTIDSVSGVLTFVSPKNFESTTDANTDGVYEVEVMVSDGNSGSDAQTINVTVTDVNEAPNSSFDILNTQRNTTLNLPAPGLLGNDSDPDGDVLTVSLVTGPNNGSLILNADGSLSYTPDTDFVGLDGFTYQISDGSLSPALPTVVDINVLAANTAPTITSDGGGATANLNVSENQTTVTTVTSNDADGDSVTYSISGGADAALFTIDGVSGALEFSASPDFESPTDADLDNIYEVIVQADDAWGGSTTQSINVSITNASDSAPALSDHNMTLAESAATGLILHDFNDSNTGVDTDGDGESLTYSLIAGNIDGLFAIDSATGVVTLANSSALDYESNNFYTLEVSASDGSISTTAQLNIQIENVNESPVITATPTIMVDEDESVHFNQGGPTLGVSDPDSDLANIEVTVTVTHGNLTLGDQSSLSSVPVSSGLDHFVIRGSTSAINQALQGLAFSPDADFNGQATLSVVANDLGNTGSGPAISTSEQITINLLPINDAPSLEMPDDLFIAPGESISFITELKNLTPLQDIDSNGTLHNLSLRIENATLSLSEDSLMSEVSIEQGSRLSAATDISSINEILSALIITPVENYSGPLVLNINIEDTGSDDVGHSRSINTQVHLFVGSVPIETTEENKLDTEDDKQTDGVQLVPIYIDEGHYDIKEDSDQESEAFLYLPKLSFKAVESTTDDVISSNALPILIETEQQSFVQNLSLIERHQVTAVKLLSAVEEVIPEAQAFTPSLTELQQSLSEQNDAPVKLTVRIAEFTGAGLVVGSVVWLIKSTSLLSSLLISYPAWRGMDPLPVLLPKDKEISESGGGIQEKPKNPRFQLQEQDSRHL